MKPATMNSSSPLPPSSDTHHSPISPRYGYGHGPAVGEDNQGDVASPIPQIYSTPDTQRAGNMPRPPRAPMPPPHAHEQCLFALRGQIGLIKTPLAGQLGAIAAVFAAFKDSEKVLENMSRHHPDHKGLAQCKSGMSHLVKTFSAALAVPGTADGINPARLNNQQIQAICQGLAACLPTAGPMLFLNNKAFRVALQTLTNALVTRAMECGLPDALQANGEVLGVLNWLSRALKADLLAPSEPIKCCFEKSLLLMHEWTGGDQCRQLLTDHNLGRCAVQLSTMINDSGVDLLAAVHAGPAHSSTASEQAGHGQVLLTNGTLLQQCILQICAPAVLGRLATAPADVVGLLNVGNLVRYAIEKRVLAVDDPQVTPVLGHLILVIGTLSARELVGKRKDCQPLSNFANLLRTLVDQEEQHALLFQQSLPSLGVVCTHLIAAINSIEFGNGAPDSQSLSNLISFVKVCDRMLDRRAAAIGATTTTASSGIVVSSMATPLMQAALVKASQRLVDGIGRYGARYFPTPAALGGLLGGLAYLWRRNLVPVTPAMGELLKSLLEQVGQNRANTWNDKSKRVVLPLLKALMSLGMTTPEKALGALTRLIPALENSPGHSALAVLETEIARLGAFEDTIVALPLAQIVPVGTKISPLLARGLSDGPPGWTCILEPSAIPVASPVWPVGSKEAARNTTGNGSTSTTTSSPPAWRNTGKKAGAGFRPASTADSPTPEADQVAESAGYDLVADGYGAALPSHEETEETQELPESDGPQGKETLKTRTAGKGGRKKTKTTKPDQQKASALAGDSLSAAEHGDTALAEIILAGNATGVLDHFNTRMKLVVKREVLASRFYADMNLALALVMTKLDSVDGRILAALDVFFELLIGSHGHGTELLIKYFANHEPQFAGLKRLLVKRGILVEEVQQKASPQAMTISRKQRTANEFELVDVPTYIGMPDGTTRPAIASFAVYPSKSASASEKDFSFTPEKITLATPRLGADLLVIAAQNNDVDVVRKILKSVLATARSEGQATALMLAAQNGCTRVVRTLLEHGPVEEQLLATHENGMNPLMFAAKDNRIDIAKILLAGGSVLAQVSQSDNEGWNALFWAVSKGHADLARLLLNIDHKGQQAVVQNIRGANPLMFAAQENNTTIVRMLLASPLGAQQVLAQDKKGRNALMYAIHMKHEQTIRLLLNAKSARQQATALDELNFNALTFAASMAFERGVRSLLTVDFADDLANPASTNGVSALSIAAQKGHVNIVRMLLKLKTAERQSEYVSEKIPSALILAASRGHLAVVKELLLLKNARKQASMVDSHGRSALAIARALDYPAIIKLLEPYSAE